MQSNFATFGGQSSLNGGGSFPATPAATSVGGKGMGLEGSYQAIYEAPQSAAATEERLTAQGFQDLFGSAASLEQMMGHTDGVLDRESGVAQPGIGKYFGNAAFFTKSPVSMDQAFAGVISRQDSDIEEGLNSVNNASLDQNLEAEEEDVGAADPTADLLSTGNAEKDELFAPSGTLGSTLDVVDPSLGGAPNTEAGSEFNRALRQVMP